MIALANDGDSTPSEPKAEMLLSCVKVEGEDPMQMDSEHSFKRFLQDILMDDKPVSRAEIVCVHSGLS